MDDNEMDQQTIQSLPRELSLPDDGILRISPLRELESLRDEEGAIVLTDIQLDTPATEVFAEGAPAGEVIAALPGDAVEIRISVARFVTQLSFVLPHSTAHSLHRKSSCCCCYGFYPCLYRRVW